MGSRLRTKLIAVAGLLVSTACDPSRHANMHQSNPGDEVSHTLSVPEWRLYEELRIGKDGLDTDVLFQQIAGILVGRDGEILVLDRKGSNKINVFDCLGRHVRALGKSGRGPGELVNPTGLAGWLPTGEIVVVDPGQAAYLILDSTGVERLRLPRPYSVAIYPARLEVDKAGQIWEEIPGGGGINVVQFNANMKPEAIHPLPLPSPPRSMATARDGRLRITIPFSGQLIHHVSKDRTLYYAMSDEYVVSWSNLADPVRAGVIQRVAEPALVTDECIAGAMAGLEWFIQQGGRLTPSMLPQSHPVLRRLWTDDRDQLWVERNRDGTADHLQFDVYDTNGIPIASVTGPRARVAAAVPVVRGGFIYLVLLDLYDVPFLARFRIQGWPEPQDPCGM
jgi:hypothetical protein